VEDEYSSRKEAAPEDGWEEKAKMKIVRLTGHENDRRRRVSDAGILYRRTWKNMQKILCRPAPPREPLNHSNP
jgi:hypothetical protein